MARTQSRSIPSVSLQKILNLPAPISRDYLVGDCVEIFSHVLRLSSRNQRRKRSPRPPLEPVCVVLDARICGAEASWCSRAVPAREHSIMPLRLPQRLWAKADPCRRSLMSAFGGKADISERLILRPLA